MSDPNDQERVALLCQRLGLPEGALPLELALHALRHGSFVHERKQHGEKLASNERLEFLGDAVLDLAVSARCFELFPEMHEGALTRLRAAVVNEDALALAARRIQLGELLLLGRGEERSQGRDKQSLLANGLEAVVAAVYLARGAVEASDCVVRMLGPMLEEAASGLLGRDYKTELQELAQANHKTSPQYRVVDSPGPEHARVYRIELTLLGELLSRGSGKSKKEAEQAAARLAVELLAGKTPEPQRGERGEDPEGAEKNP